MWSFTSSRAAIRTLGAALLLGGLAAAGCSTEPGTSPEATSGGGSGGAENPLPTTYSIWFEPTDGFTATGTTVPAIGLTGAASADALAGVASRVSLRTWPELAAVSSTVTTIPGSAEPVATPPRVEVSPNSTLGDRWYVLKLDSMPSGYAWNDVSIFHDLGGGAYGARFRPTSEARFWGASVCDQGSGTYSIHVRTTEVIYATGGASNAVQFTYTAGGSPTCSVAQEPVQSNPIPEVPFACSALDPTKEIKLTINAGLFSSGGAALSGTGAYTFTVNALSPDSQGCKLFRP